MRRRATRRTPRTGRVLLAALHACCVTLLALPPALLAPSAAAATAGDAALSGFAARATAMGLVPAGTVLVEPAGVTAAGDRVVVATTMAAAPPGYGATPVFFTRHSSFRLAEDSGLGTGLVESELQVGEEAGLVTIDAYDRLPQSVPETNGPVGNLAGLEIHRHIELRMEGFDRVVAAVTDADAPDHADRPALLEAMIDDGELALSDFRHTVTVRYPDGRERAFAGSDFTLDALFDDLGAAVTQGTTLYDCFAAIGVDLTIFGASCLVAGTVVCAVGCAVTAGVACIPCISGASLACGLGAAVGSLGYCLAKVLFGVDPPPTATPVPTRTRTPTATATPVVPGDCDGDARVSVAELVRGVSIALGRAQLTECPSFDVDRDGRLSIGEIIAAVRRALGR